MKRVLLVDDDPDILESTALLLGLEGYEVRTLSDPSKLEDEVQRFQPDVLLQDVNMPGLDLRQAIARVRATLPRAIIILFTAAPDAKALKERFGADDLLAKPFEVHELHARIQRAHRLTTLI